MEIFRSCVDTAKGPANRFTGDVYIDAVTAPGSPTAARANMVHFAPGARTAWHAHPLGQTIHVTEGVGLCQRRGGPIAVIAPGDTVYFAPDEEHWHGAAPNRLMSHLAVNEGHEPRHAAVWGPKVTNAEYGAAPPTGVPRSAWPTSCAAGSTHAAASSASASSRAPSAAADGPAERPRVELAEDGRVHQARRVGDEARARR